MVILTYGVQPVGIDLEKGTTYEILYRIVGTTNHNTTSCIKPITRLHN